MDDASILEGIRKLARQHGGIAEIEICAFRKLQGGNSSEIWAFDGRWGTEATRPLILRSGMDNEFAFGGRGAEFDILKALEGAGLPVPRVYWFDETGAFLQRPAMIMDRCSGASDRNLMTERNALGLNVDDRVALGRQMMGLLAGLHTADPSALAIDAPQQWMSAEQHLAQLDEAIARLEAEPTIELSYASWWLWRHLPARPSKPVIVHGDYRPANMLVEDRRISAILDWEFAHLGDPAEDLGWYLTPYYASEHLVPTRFDTEAAIAAYEAASGVQVDRAAVRFWSAFAMYKLAYMTVAALRWLIDGDPSRMASSAEFIVRPLLDMIARSDDGDAR